MSPAKKMRADCRDQREATPQGPVSSRAGSSPEKWCAGVSVIGNCRRLFASSHQSSSSIRRIPADLTRAPFPKGVTTIGSKRSASMRSVRQVAVIVVVVAQQDGRRSVGGRRIARPAAARDAVRGSSVDRPVAG